GTLSNSKLSSENTVPGLPEMRKERLSVLTAQPETRTPPDGARAARPIVMETLDGGVRAGLRLELESCANPRERSSAAIEGDEDSVGKLALVSRNEPFVMSVEP